MQIESRHTLAVDYAQYHLNQFSIFNSKTLNVQIPNFHILNFQILYFQILKSQILNFQILNFEIPSGQIRVVRRNRESLLLREKTPIVTIYAPKLL